MIYPVVQELAADRIPVAVACRVLGVSTSGYYAWLGRARSTHPASGDGSIETVRSSANPWSGVPEAEQDVLLARSAAEAAGHALVRARAARMTGEPAAELHGDRIAHTAIRSVLAHARPHDVVLSNAAAGGVSRLSARRVWIVDPLDGSREFAEPGRVDWTVHVALWQRDGASGEGALVAGAVALPALGITMATDRPPRSRRSGGRLRIAVSRNRPPAMARQVAGKLGADLVPMGSAGFTICAVVRGEVDAYLHADGQHEWDSAAPVAVAVAAGMHASRLDGSSLHFNQPRPWLPDLVVCRPESAGPILGALSLVGAC